MECDKRFFGFDSFVVVCDGDHCDFLGNIKSSSVGAFKRLISSRDKYRFEIIESLIEDEPKGETTIKVHYDKSNQKMLGFGGAFSDAAGMAIKSLSSKAQSNLMRSYFGEEGIEYNLCRIPIGGTDFSTRPYSYDDVEGDVQLNHFALAEEDLKYKIPLIHEALKLSSRKIRLFGSPWSPPSWMKENGKFNGKGGLLKEMWDPYSKYIVRFVQEYEKKGIKLWGLTTTNEPLAGFEDWKWNACAFSSTDTRNWLKKSFGPTLDKEGYRHLKIMMYESQRKGLPSYPAETLDDPEAAKYVDGISVHWYEDKEYGPEVLEETHLKFPDKFLLYTEACEGTEGELQDRVHLGSWNRAENYAANIIEDINHYVAGWVDWNMALDMQGRPNWAFNFVDSPIIVNSKSDEFYKQPMFYAMGHFSKFIFEGSERLSTDVECNSKALKVTALKNPNHSYSIVLLNTGEEAIGVNVSSPSKKFMNILMEPKSIETIFFYIN